MNALIPWPGGKRLLKNEIIRHFPVDFDNYVEVCCGGASLFFGLERRKCEVLNDKDADLINFYKVVQDQKKELLAALRWDLVSRRLFHSYRDELMNKKDLTAVRRAHLFYYVMKTSFGGKRESFGINLGKTPKLNLKRVESIINQAHERLQGVVIEELDWLKVIQRYDRKDTLFYIDPPYRLKSSKMYCGKMQDSDYTALRLLLGSIKGKFILSINDAPFFRELFEEYNIKEVTTRYGIAKGSRRAKELLIMNYRPGIIGG